MESQNVADWTQVYCEPNVGISNSTFLLDWVVGGAVDVRGSQHPGLLGRSSKSHSPVEIESEWTQAKREFVAALID